MTIPNTAQATGPMTLEQGLQSFKAKMAEKGVKPDDLVKPLTPEGFEVEDQTEEPEEVATEEPAQEENTETVSTDEPEESAPELASESQQILLQDGSKVTVEEARKGYLRNADYTRKTQAVAQERDAFIAEKQAAVQQIGALYQQLASLQEQEPNWLQLAQDPNVDPKQLQASQAYWQHKKTAMEQARQLMQHTQAQASNAAKAKAFQTLNAGEFEPTWKDPKVLQSALGTISEYILERGIPAEMLEHVNHHAIIEMAEESRRYRELQKQKPKAALAVKGKPQPFKPGAKSTASPQAEQIRSLEEAFRKNPSIDNATKLERAKSALRR